MCEYILEIYAEIWNEVYYQGTNANVPVIHFRVDREDLEELDIEDILEKDPFNAYIAERYQNIDWLILHGYLVENMAQILPVLAGLYKVMKLRCIFGTSKYAIMRVQGAIHANVILEDSEINFMDAIDIQDMRVFLDANLVNDLVANVQALPTRGVNIPSTMLQSVVPPPAIPTVSIYPEFAFVELAVSFRALGNTTKGGCKMIRIMLDLRLIPNLGAH